MQTLSIHLSGLRPACRAPRERAWPPWLLPARHPQHIRAKYRIPLELAGPGAAETAPRTPAAAGYR